MQFPQNISQCEPRVYSNLVDSFIALCERAGHQGLVDLVNYLRVNVPSAGVDGVFIHCTVRHRHALQSIHDLPHIAATQVHQCLQTFFRQLNFFALSNLQ